MSSFVLKYSPTSSNDASAQLAGQSDPTEPTSTARSAEEERGAAARAATAAALLLFARARGAWRRGLQRRAEDMVSLVEGGRSWRSGGVAKKG